MKINGYEIVKYVYGDYIFETPNELRKGLLEYYVSNLLKDMAAQYGKEASTLKFVIFCNLLLLHNIEDQNKCLKLYGLICDSVRGLSDYNQSFIFNEVFNGLFSPIDNSVIEKKLENAPNYKGLSRLIRFDAIVYFATLVSLVEKSQFTMDEHRFFYRFVDETDFANSVLFDCLEEEGKKLKKDHTIADRFSLEAVLNKEILPSESDFEIVDGTLVKYKGSQKNVVIPKGIKKIGNECFERMQFIETVEIPDGVESIGSFAFSFCNSLRSIVLPNTVMYLERGCFSRCSELAAVVLSTKLESISVDCFDGCKKLKSICLPDGLKTICAGAFRYCELLENIDFPESLEEISMCAFEGCKSLKVIKLPRKINYIDRKCFSACTNLEKVKLNEGIKYIGFEAFSYCRNLKYIFIPKTVEKVWNNSFLYCNQATFLCEHDKKPEEWMEGWNPSDSRVVWGFID